jgi:hypothetical protein
MKGRRLLPVDGKPTFPKEPGDYCGPVMGYTGGKPAVLFLKPNARDDGAPPRARAVQHVVSPPHVFTEEDDGTLTISASISDMAGDGTGGSDGWHGYLEHGEWRQV